MEQALQSGGTAPFSYESIRDHIIGCGDSRRDGALRRYEYIELKQFGIIRNVTLFDTIAVKLDAILSAAEPAVLHVMRVATETADHDAGELFVFALEPAAGMVYTGKKTLDLIPSSGAEALAARLFLLLFLGWNILICVVVIILCPFVVGLKHLPQAFHAVGRARRLNVGYSGEVRLTREVGRLLAGMPNVRVI